MSLPGIALDNDYTPQFAFTEPDASTGLYGPATGLSGMTCRISATDGGAAIHASLDQVLTEWGGTPGTYYVRFDGDNLRSHLAAYVGQSVYVVVGDGTNVHISKPVRVRERRRG